MNQKPLKNDIIIYSDNDNLKIEILYSNENVWLPLSKIAELFGRDKSVISRHINNIFKEGELDNSTVAFFATVQNEGKRIVERDIEYYNLDMIISVGYRVNSKIATKFRKWATTIIKDYMIQGFALDDNRFIEGKRGDNEYFQRLLERIKLIRTSEQMFYQKITDIFAECSIDYDKKSDIARNFYATIQNKFYYAITKKTASEIIYNRVDSTKRNMGLTSWNKSPDGKILKSDIVITKNYLSETELRNLNSIINIFLDIAEDNARRKIPMYMNDWIKEVDNVLRIRHYDILKDNGKMLKDIAKLRAEIEYEEYKFFQDKQYLSDFDRMIDEMNKISLKMETK